MKKKFIVANWKLNGDIKTISNFLKNLKLKAPLYLKYNTIIIAPSTIYLERVYKNIKDINIFVSAQDVDINKKGAFTGETSILMLKDIGVKYVIIGHSERRFLHNEDNKLITEKFGLIKSLNLIPILCIGESENERKENKTKEVIKNQLSMILKRFGNKIFTNTIIAYEPIWAIGTGISADPIYVQSIHKFIKNYINTYDANNIEKLIVQYGGSINSKNAKNFLEQPDIDGLLIGSASLIYEEFLKILKISNDILVNN
ncbi:triose-phosphate isomerase [Buchnera aphidicola (Aphis helianthi)]|uniref:Triosephosphate isomerase n=1 Tax=Buchnera aphidicola (Aphis helianthi) TaxID=2315802 RepID=A0A4D6XQ43_9GAMM|nr:triose-phosphate isomerase [Buchnera aphidicola]QCI17127.1 triose-phosphate isomerase [Buchnera aphidicola (Aphis helianthi)]